MSGGRRWARDDDERYRVTTQIRFRLTADELARMLAEVMRFQPVLSVVVNDAGHPRGVICDGGTLGVGEVTGRVLDWLMVNGTKGLAELPEAPESYVVAARVLYEVPDVAR